MTDPSTTALELNFLARWLPDPPFHRVLDLCCGYGRHASLLAERGYKVLGVDVNPVPLARAEQLSGGAVQYHLLDMRNLALLEGVFDGIINLWQSFGYFDAATNTSILEQISSKLRRGGRFIIDLYNRNYFTQPHAVQPIQRYQRNGQTIVGTRRLIGNRLVVELDYGSEQSQDRFDWQLYTSDELCATAAAFGLTPQVICAWWDETRLVSSEDARMQIVFERTSGLDAAGHFSEQRQTC